MAQYASDIDDDKIFYFELAMTLAKQYMYKLIQLKYYTGILLQCQIGQKLLV